MAIPEDVIANFDPSRQSVRRVDSSSLPPIDADQVEQDRFNVIEKAEQFRQKMEIDRRDQALRETAVTFAVQFSSAPGKGGNIHEMLKWADEINAYLVDGSLKGKENG